MATDAPSVRAPSEPRTLSVSIHPRQTFVALAAFAVLISVIGVVTAVAYDQAGRAPDWGLRFVDVNGEANLPAWYSVLLLAASSLVIAAIARSRRAEQRADWPAWAVLAVFVLVMSLDEMAGIHELVGGQIDDRWEVPVIGGYAWIIPGTIVGVVGLLVLLRAFTSLTPRTKRDMLVAVALFGAGALGLEVVEARITGSDPDVGVDFFLVTGAQECLEMVGAALFLTLLVEELCRTSTVIDLRDPLEQVARPSPV